MNHTKRRSGQPPLWIDRNPEIYTLMKKYDLRQWEIADILNLHPDTLGRKLRYELSSNEKKDIISKVKQYCKEHPNGRYQREE